MSWHIEGNLVGNINAFLGCVGIGTTETLAFLFLILPVTVVFFMTQLQMFNNQSIQIYYDSALAAVWLSFVAVLFWVKEMVCILGNAVHLFCSPPPRFIWEDTTLMSVHVNMKLEQPAAGQLSIKPQICPRVTIPTNAYQWTSDILV